MRRMVRPSGRLDSVGTPHKATSSLVCVGSRADLRDYGRDLRHTDASGSEHRCGRQWHDGIPELFGRNVHVQLYRRHKQRLVWDYQYGSSWPGAPRLHRNPIPEPTRSLRMVEGETDHVGRVSYGFQACWHGLLRSQRAEVPRGRWINAPIIWQALHDDTLK